MSPETQKPQVLALLILLTVLATSGCSIVVEKATDSFGTNLTSAILNQDDPELVRDGMPAYILLMDSLVEGNPDNPPTLSAAANLYASYGAVFVDDELRAMRLTSRARDYALRAMCNTYADSCDWRQLNYDDFVATLDGLTEKHAETVYIYGFATLAYLRAHSSDWNSMAELPQAEALMKRYLEISGESANASAHTYLGVILTILPPALGGKPEEARTHFEKAIALSGGRDLGAKIEFVKSYAKLLYDQELHDQIVNEVLDADPKADRLTLTNVLAQEEALRLRAEASDYF
jgi:hypothetical protein